MERSFEERMEAYPELKKHMEQMLDVVENVGRKVDKANDAEIQVVENMRKIGATALQEWAVQREKTAIEEWKIGQVNLNIRKLSRQNCRSDQEK